MKEIEGGVYPNKVALTRTPLNKLQAVCVEGVFTWIYPNKSFGIDDALTSPLSIIDDHTNGPQINKANPIYGVLSSTADPQTAALLPSTGELTKADVIYIAFYVLVMFFAIVGNTLVIITISSSRRMRSVTNIFLLSMAVSDLLIALVCIPINLTGKVLTRFIFGPVVCSLVTYIIGVSVMVSTYTMLAISIERYCAICKPLASRSWQTNSHAYKTILAIWLASLIVMLPYVIGSKLKDRAINPLKQCVPTCRMIISDPALSIAWYSFLFFQMFVIPGALMTVAYTKVCLKLFKEFEFNPQQKNENNTNKTAIEDTMQRDRLMVHNQYASTTLTTSNSNLKKEKNLRNSSKKSDAQESVKKKVTIMLLVVVILYFLCWTPLYVVNMWRAINPTDALRRFNQSIRVIKIMSYISTCVNPIVYCFVNKRFRLGFIKAFMCCLPDSCTSKLHRRPHGRTCNMTSENTQNMTMTSSTRARCSSVTRA